MSNDRRYGTNADTTAAIRSVLSSVRENAYLLNDFESASRSAATGLDRASASVAMIWSRTYTASAGFFTRASTVKSDASTLDDGSTSS